MTPKSLKNNQTDSQKRFALPVFFVSLTFLLITLGIQALYQWQSAKKSIEIQALATGKSFIAQGEITVRSAFNSSRLFSNSHARLLASYNNDSQDKAEHQQTLKKMKDTFFDFSGFFILDNSANIKHSPKQAAYSEENRLVQQSLKQLTGNQLLFPIYFDDVGFMYYTTKFKFAGEEYFFIVRRIFHSFSNTIFSSNFPGFTLFAVETNSKKTLMEKGAYHKFDNMPLYKNDNRTIFSQPIYGSNLSLNAAFSSLYHKQLFEKIVLPKLITIIAFILIIIALWQYLKRIHRDELMHEEEQRLLRQRANNVLSAIDESVITTDQYNNITYLNPQAQLLIKQTGEQAIVGDNLSQVWPIHSALWNKNLSLEELSLLDEEIREICLELGNSQRTVEQSYSIMYDNEANASGVAWVLRDVTDAVNARKAIEISRKRYKEIFSGSGIAHCLIKIEKDKYLSEKNLQIDLVHANLAAIQLFQAENLDQLLVNFPKILNESLGVFNKTIRKAIGKENPHVEFELTLNTLHGEEVVLIANLSLTTDETQNALLTLVNITERRRFTTALHEREQFWSRVMKTVPDIVFVVSLDKDNNLSFEYSNRMLAYNLGYTPRDLERIPELANWVTHVDPNNIHLIQAGVSEIIKLKEGEVFISNGVMRDKNKIARTYQITNTPFEFNDAGKLVRYVGTARDITEDVNSQKAISENEKKYRLLAENVSDVIWSANTRLESQFISPSVEKLTGYNQEELYQKSLAEIIHKDDWQNIENQLNRFIKNRYKGSKDSNLPAIDARLFKKDGEKIIIEFSASIYFNGIGAIDGVIAIIRDVSEARHLDNELRLTAQVFENSNEAIIVTNNKREIVNINRAFTDLTQFTLDDIKGKKPDVFLTNSHLNREFLTNIRTAIDNKGYWQGEIDYQTKTGEEKVGWTGTSAVKDRQGKIQNLIVVTSDITEKKINEQRIHKLAYFDPLTGLPNRSQMHERLEVLLVNAQNKNQSVALLFIDLDRFKPINDSMGHPAGDKVLKEVALRLRSCIKRNDLVARMGGDEFTIALEQQENADKAADTAVKVGERVLHQLSKAIEIEGKELHISASIGISIYPNDGKTVTELLKNSDMAMYHAKDTGRSSVKFFNASMNSKAVELLELENQLRFALDRHEFELHYQPQLSSADHSIKGVEALLRWNHPQKGIVSPAVFIPIIEDTGLIVPIGEWVLNQACKDLALWQQSGVPIPRVAVNVSARQFKQKDFVDLVERTISNHGINPEQLEVELTESILIDNIDLTLSVLNHIRDMGVRIAIDDFGTGYSSLNYLRQFPLDTLKVDQSFIRNLTTNKDDMQITRTIVSMAHNLGLGVVAEGVETKEQLDVLTELQCEEIQGFYFSKARTPNQLLGFIEQQAESKKRRDDNKS